MNYICLKPRAKINVALDVLSKREDGYHNLCMVMQTLTLHDVLFIKKIDKQCIDLKTNIRWLPTNHRNLVYKAADYLITEFKIGCGLYIELVKNIPISAGLGGGSSDCAATLVGIRNLFKLPLSNGDLINIGRYFGADVPYCVMQGTALAQGIGEKLVALPPHPKTYVLLAKPPIPISTKTVFKNFNFNNIKTRPNIEMIIENLKTKDLYEISKGMANVLESVTEVEYPVISEIKEIMYQNNAIISLMSGSGPTVFGYFDNKEEAYICLRDIKRSIPSIKDFYMSTIYNPLNKRSDSSHVYTL